MFVSRKKYERLERRVEQLETVASTLSFDLGYRYFGDITPSRAYPTLRQVVYSALRHFGLEPILVERGIEVKIVKKETPCQQQ